MKKLTTYFSLSFSLLLVASCTGDFEEMNTSPNQATEVSVTPDLLLPYIIEKPVDLVRGSNVRNERLNLDGGMLWIQHFARRVYTYEGDTYSPSGDLAQNTWEKLYTETLLNAERIRLLATSEEQKNAHYEGVSLVMRSWVYSLLTDIFGPVPYSQSLKAKGEEEILKPAYDPMPVVYEGIINDLDQAVALLAQDAAPIGGDILFRDGSTPVANSADQTEQISRWIKFANSLQLKLLNRASSAPSFSIDIAAKMTEVAQRPIFTSNEDFAYLAHSATRPSNNEWNEVVVNGGRDDWRASATLVDALNALNDPRVTVFFDPTPEGVYAGMPNGLPDALALEFTAKASFIGASMREATTPSVIMSYAELQFVLAEAALRGDVAGDPKAYLDEAIDASFGQFGLETPGGYLAGQAATLENIMFQKWIALYGQGIEAWTEYRRTGLPDIMRTDPNAALLNEGVLPTRLTYPQTEYSLNREKIQEGLGLLGGDDNMRTKLWWAQ